MNKSAFIRLFFVVLLTQVYGQNRSVNDEPTINGSFRAELVAEGFNIPWGFDFLPNSQILVTEKSGGLFLVSNGKKTEIAGIPKVKQVGQGGLLDVKVHPNYSQNGWIYLTYSSDNGGGGANTALTRGKIENNRWVANKLLYKASPNSRKPYHFGSRIAFDDEGYIYFTIGDRGDRDVNPQDITKDGGKVYRLHDDGRIPTDNPFVNENGAKKAVYSYGHRNPQGMVKNPFTGEIWLHEHGPKGGDELNIIKKGGNYGWPVITYGINYDGTTITDQKQKSGMMQPLYYWVPSIAPSGMVFVNSDKYPEWEGDLLVGSLVFQYLEHLVMKDGKVSKREKLLDGIGRMRSIEQGPDGYIYIGVEGKGIFRLVPK